MGFRDLLLIGAVTSGAAALAAGVLRPQVPPPQRNAARAAVPPTAAADLAKSIEKVNAAVRQGWDEAGVSPAPVASELALMRRLALALCGTVPSVEEIRRFEARPPVRRLELWLDDLLHDRRFADYVAERFARAYVGTEDGPFLLFRRRKFTTWLSDAILENRSYDAIVHDVIADRGLWTDHPATNFVSVTFDPEAGRPDPERLGARVARAFLGVRLDCAQCHDHPFQPWKQADFRGLAAFFGSVHSNLRGIHEGQPFYKPPDKKTKEPTNVEPRVPFCPELKPGSGNPREQLAAWIVNPKNPNLARATVNRVWALLLGRPLVEPIDDFPVSGDLPAAIEILADDFTAHGFDLHRLIRV
ncbi:MAG TPA: DUF1549 domain-containing protein, partial [Isosphaeraceae bacterium]|nr:DUF1549 domain-containing protein [Isosphaeraceae bacterium]